jgi:hypothetical protein
MSIEEAIIDGILKIANSPKIVEKYQGNIMFKDKVERWHVQQILTAQVLLQHEWEKHGKDTRGTI